MGGATGALPGNKWYVTLTCKHGEIEYECGGEGRKLPSRAKVWLASCVHPTPDFEYSPTRFSIGGMSLPGPLFFNFVTFFN